MDEPDPPEAILTLASTCLTRHFLARPQLGFEHRNPRYKRDHSVNKDIFEIKYSLDPLGLVRVPLRGQSVVSGRGNG